MNTKSLGDAPTDARIRAITPDAAACGSRQRSTASAGDRSGRLQQSADHAGRRRSASGQTAGGRRLNSFLSRALCHSAIGLEVSAL
jgi:hypothetical protein